MFWTKANIIFYGSCTVATIILSIGLISIIGQNDLDSQFIHLLPYDDEFPATVRAYKPDDKKINYLEKCNSSYEKIREHLEVYKNPDNITYSIDLGECQEDLQIKTKKTGKGPRNGTKSSMWGIVDRQPCVFIQFRNLDKVEDKIDYFDKVDEKLPESMPQTLKDTINKTLHMNEAAEKYDKIIWISCDGEHEHNRKNIKNIEYYPFPGFDMDSYPSCTNGECSHGLAYPLVAVKFKKVETHVGIYIVCKLWTRDGVKDSLRFQLYVD